MLVNLPGVIEYGFTPSPLGLLYLAAYLQKENKGTKVEIVDGALKGEEEVYKRIKKFKPDLIGLSVMTPSRQKAIEVTKELKRLYPSVKVVLGGIQPSLMWRQMMAKYPLVDYVIRGEGEITLSELVSGVKIESIEGLVWRNDDGKVMDNKSRSLIKDLDMLPFPAWGLINPDDYPPRGEGIIDGIDLSKVTRFHIIFSRGCMGSCTFCSTWRVWSGYRCRKGVMVADEVEMMVKKLGAKHIAFMDDTLTGNKDEIIGFCKEIIRRKIKVAFFGCTRVDQVDDEILGWMKKAGFYYLSYGIESGSPEMLKRINKKTNMEEVELAAKLTKKNGIQLGALIMYGLPEESEEDRRLTQELLERIKPDDLGSVGEVWIFPGTALFEQAKKYELIGDDFWLGPEPYYIYRGGIGEDIFDWKKRYEDKKRYHNLSKTGGKFSFWRSMWGEKRLLKMLALNKIKITD